MSPSYSALLLALLAASVSGTPLVQRSPASATGAVGPNPPSAAPAPVNSALIEQVEVAPNAAARLNILTGNGKDFKPFVFDFNGKPDTGAGGHLVLADRSSMPALVDLGISSAVGFMNPCGMNTAHTHPRATEFYTVVEGEIETGFIQENTFTTEVKTTLSKFQGTVFPMGSIHFQFNNQCTPAIFVAGLNHEDPGASAIAQNFFALDQDIVDFTLGFPAAIDGSNFEQFKDAIPKSFAQNIKTCLSKCANQGHKV
ncbi:MAG: hypothetical protein Q9227_000400 [Pyrenula ochraceoflavens]